MVIVLNIIQKRMLPIFSRQHPLIICQPPVVLVHACLNYLSENLNSVGDLARPFVMSANDAAIVKATSSL